MIHELAMIEELYEMFDEVKTNINKNETLENTVDFCIENWDDLKFDCVELQWLKELSEK